MAFLRRQSTSSDHERLLHDFQGQENDVERQEVNSWSPAEAEAENEPSSEDGGKTQKENDGVHIYPRGPAGHDQNAHLQDIKSKHQDHHVSVSDLDLGSTKQVSPYHRNYSKVRHGVDILNSLFTPYLFIYSLAVDLLNTRFRLLSFTHSFLHKHLPSLHLLMLIVLTAFFVIVNRL